MITLDASSKSLDPLFGALNSTIWTTSGSITVPILDIPAPEYYLADAATLFIMCFAGLTFSWEI